MIPHYIVLSLSTLACMLFCSTTYAQKAPRSLTELEGVSDAIVIGEIKAVRMESRPSQIESGFGNTDWVITLTLAVREVKVGDFSPTELDVRCIRIRSRKSIFGLVSLTGHRPIPDVGTLARFYLKKDGDAWAVVMPNGIAAVSNVDTGQFSRLSDALQIRDLASPRYTFMLPIELWGIFALIAVLAVPVIRRFQRRIPRKHRQEAT